MKNRLRLLDDVVSQSLAHERKSGGELRHLIDTMNKVFEVSAQPEELEQLAREIEERLGITMGLGAMVDDENFRPWLDEAKAGIDPYYWNRYKKLLQKNGLPQDIITTTDEITDRILGRLGNPAVEEGWDRRGMVVGHVQSGKTANYTGLICKAADAGYRLIIVIAGIHNNLRNQTQARIDEGFRGRETCRIDSKGRQYNRNIGAGLFETRRIPVSLTTTLADFHKKTASDNTSSHDSYKEPVFLVIKKNHNTLTNLLDWLKNSGALSEDKMIDQPMLLIDDEADNASINTKYSKQEITKINGQIRDLLNLFHRSCYVGYTATPFANIFIDPDGMDDVLREDLFPKHFIVGLDAPSNYFGAKKIFMDGIPDEGNPTWLRSIEDNEDILPIKHRIDHYVTELPASLKQAVRTLLISRTIMNLRGKASSHCSMLVNASRFTGVQGHLRRRIHEYLTTILDSLRVNATLGKDGLRDPHIKELHETWALEYEESEADWEKIQKSIHSAVAAAKVVEVNSKENGLDYDSESSIGQTIIAIGGFSLSRGLTLEGLTVTWFLRNTMMYDTLMQMGRWYGYRLGYEDLCRIWMPPEAIDWYAHIAEASEELHLELKKMEKAKRTPSDFGLAVRSHPASLQVTARNKMGDGKKHVLIGLSNRWIETSRISAKVRDIELNEKAAGQFLADLDSSGFTQSSAQRITGGFHLEEVPVEIIDRFLAGWQNHETAFLTQTEPIRSYIGERKENELKEWDVLITEVTNDCEKYKIGGWSLRPQKRVIGFSDLENKLLTISGKRARIASRGVEKVGVAPQSAQRAEKEYLAEIKQSEIPESKRPSYPDWIYRQVREKPLFVLHLVRVHVPENKENMTNLDAMPTKPVVGWSMSLPKSSIENERVEYIINTQKFRELFGTVEDEEGAHED